MPLNIPNQLATGWEPIKQGFYTGVNFYDKLVNQGLTRAQQKKILELLPFQKQQAIQSMSNARAAAGRAAELQPLRLQALRNKLDPNFEMNNLMRALQGYGGSEQGGNPPMFGSNIGEGAAQGMGAPNAGMMDEEGIEGIRNMLGAGTPQPNQGVGMGALQAPEKLAQPFPSEQEAMPGEQKSAMPEQKPKFDLQKLMADNSLKGIATKAYLQKHAPWLLKEANAPYQGEARNALDMQRLKSQYGENSEVYQNAKAQRDAKLQNQKDLSLVRDRSINGLKPGERLIKNEQTGEIEGIEHNATQKEIKQDEGRIMFNEFYPLVYKGASPFSGEGSIKRLENVVSRYKTDPKARKMVDDLLLADKVLTATVINEAATLDSGKTNQTYKQLRESLQADDVPGKLKSLMKQYQLPQSANLHAGYRFQKLLNESRQKARDMVPATRKLYFNPEAHAKAIGETELSPTGEYKDTDMVEVEGPNGKETMTYAEAKKRGAA